MISPLACSLSHESETIHIMPSSLAAGWYGAETASEQFNCSYGLNPSYRSLLANSTLTISGIGSDNEVRIIESRQHRFFVATLFQPQLRSLSGTPHPLIQAFFEAAFKRRAG